MKIFSNQGFGLLLLRLAIGGLFLWHGITKFQNMDGTIAFFGSIGLAPFWAWVTATVETVGGALMVLGLWPTIVGLLFTVIMVVAIIKTKIGGEFGAAEKDILFLLSSLALVFGGAGSCSLVKCFKSCKHKDASAAASAPTQNPPSSM